LNENTLKCHYCGHHEPEKKNCSSCGLPSLNRRGVGTQLIENEIEKKFPNVKVARLDYDTTRTKKSFKSIIRGFEEKEFDILVGTQMVTKGLDFSNVSLVCVIESDFLLNYPDFRANEKYFQMIRQVSGRAGRSKSQGTVLIQTKNVNHSLNRRLQLDDDINYFDGELAQRKEFSYPPYVKLIKIKFRSRNRKILYDGSNWFANALKKNMKSKILGPEFPIISKIKNEFLMNLLIKVNPEDKLFLIKNIVSKILKKFNTYSEFRLIKTNVDVDPYN
jgi:primosomal protein N' (replication factor Y)